MLGLYCFSSVLIKYENNRHVSGTNIMFRIPVGLENTTSKIPRYILVGESGAHVIETRKINSRITEIIKESQNTIVYDIFSRKICPRTVKTRTIYNIQVML